MNVLSRLFRRKSYEEKFMSKWKSAVKHHNKVKMLKLLNSQMDKCSNRNSNCGVEMFCPSVQ